MHAAVLVRKEIGYHSGRDAVLVAQGDYIAQFGQSLGRDGTGHLVDGLFGQQARQCRHRMNRVGSAQRDLALAFRVAINDCQQPEPVALGSLDVSCEFNRARAAAHYNNRGQCVGRAAQAASIPLGQ